MVRDASPIQQQRGLTLVELAVVLALTALLALAVASIGGNWSDRSRGLLAVSTLQRAYSAAQSLALQNHAGVSMGGASATLCVANATAKVVSGSDCTAQPIWNASLGTGTNVSLGSAGTASCLSLTSSSVGASGVSDASGGCASEPVYNLSVGSFNVQDKSFF